MAWKETMASMPEDASYLSRLRRRKVFLSLWSANFIGILQNDRGMVEIHGTDESQLCEHEKRMSRNSF